MDKLYIVEPSENSNAQEIDLKKCAYCTEPCDILDKKVLKKYQELEMKIMQQLDICPNRILKEE